MSAFLVQGEFSGTVNSNVISGKFTYDTEVTPVFPNGLASFQATVNGTAAVADDGTFHNIVNDGSCCFPSLTRDFIEMGGRFVAGPQSVSGNEISSIGISFFDVTDGTTMPDALSSTAPLSSQSQYDAFATGYSSSGTVPGGRRLFFWETINGSNHFRQGTLSSFTLSRAVPEPTSLALMGITLAGVGFKRRKAI